MNFERIKSIDMLLDKADLLKQAGDSSESEVEDEMNMSPEEIEHLKNLAKEYISENDVNWNNKDEYFSQQVIKMLEDSKEAMSSIQSDLESLRDTVDNNILDSIDERVHQTWGKLSTAISILER